MEDKRQIGPRVDAKLAEAYEWFVRTKHDGKYKGRLASEAELAFRIQLGHFAVTNPAEVEELRNEDRECADVIDDCKEIFEEHVESSPLGGSREFADEVERIDERLSGMETMLYQIFQDYKRKEMGEGGNADPGNFSRPGGPAVTR